MKMHLRRTHLVWVALLTSWAILTTTGDASAKNAGKQERQIAETILLYQLIEAYYPAFAEQMAVQGAYCPNMFSASSRINSGEVVWNTASCASAARRVIRNS